jgi:hypothetical protein
MLDGCHWSALDLVRGSCRSFLSFWFLFLLWLAFPHRNTSILQQLIPKTIQLRTCQQPQQSFNIHITEIGKGGRAFAFVCSASGTAVSMLPLLLEQARARNGSPDWHPCLRYPHCVLKEKGIWDKRAFPSKLLFLALTEMLWLFSSARKCIKSSDFSHHKNQTRHLSKSNNT